MERKKDDQMKMLNLLYTIPPDLKIVKQLDSAVDEYGSITKKTLLMCGTNSQPFFRESVKVLGTLLPGATIKTFEAFDHYSPEENFEDIASVLSDFFIG